jgi:ribonuclease T2
MELPTARLKAPGRRASECKQVGSRRLITEITIGLGARPDGNKKLADLIKTSSPTEPGCPGGTVDPVGHQ